MNFRFLSQRLLSRAKYPLEGQTRNQDLLPIVEDVRDLGNAMVLLGGTWMFGADTPLNNIGQDGDFYYNSGNKKYYLKTAGEWVFEGTIGGGGSGGMTILTYAGL